MDLLVRVGFQQHPVTFDPTMDAQSNANSGSLEVSLPFGTNGDQAVWFGTFHNAYGYDGTTILDGTKFTNITFDLDVHLSPTKPAPPKLVPTFTHPTPGLNLFSSGNNGDLYQRTNLKLQNTSGVGWLGASGPVTYSVTITNFPGATNYPRYQAHIFITTGTPGSTEAAPDYVEANLAFLDIHENADGSAYAAFRYKTNQPNGNAMVYSTGTLGTVGSSNIVGTWSMSFLQNTNITLTSPDGHVLQTNITADGAALFADPLNVYFGAQPNSAANFGQSVVLSSVSITGNTTPVSDNFVSDNGLLDTNNTWSVIAADPTTVQLFTPDPGALWVKWSLPDSGFGLQTTTNLAKPASWVTLTGPDATVGPLLSFVSASNRMVYLPSSVLGSTQAIFFRLNQQVFTKLEVLLPGETNAPGSVSGKTGTPTPQKAGVPFDVTVNALDNAGHVLNATDTIHITSTTDSSASLPADAALVGGTGTFSVTLNAAGSFTLTAADVTDSTKTSATSSSVSITP
jgi:hypothetical protein